MHNKQMIITCTLDQYTTADQSEWCHVTATDT